MSALQWVRLLAAVWAAAQCGAVQEGPAPDPGTSLSSTLDLLWTVVDRAVKSAVEPLIAEINTRLDSVQTQTADLASRLTSIEARQQTQTTDLASRLTSIEARQQTQTASLTSVRTALDGIQSELDSVKSDMVSRLDGLHDLLTARIPPPPVQTGLENNTDGVETKLTTQNVSRDCTDLPAASTSGKYMLQPSPNVSLPAFCDFDADGGGWIVIQRRADIQPRQNFDLGWQEYQQGFGELDAEFWWGLQNLWTTTSLSGRRYQLRIDLGDWSGEKRYAVYQNFTVSSESDGYRLTVSGYSGDAGDSLSYLSGSRFSTRDKDQDRWSVGSCAADYKAGWWYGHCSVALLNGPYLAQQTGKAGEGIIWYRWKGWSYSLKTVEMKIRPAVES